MNDKGKSILIGDGLRLYVQKNSPYWWLCIREEGQEKRLSTRVKIVDDPRGDGGARDKASHIAIEERLKRKYGVS